MINMPGGPEIAVILLIALIVLGPQQLPKAMRSLGNAMAEIRKLSNGFQAEMRSAMDAIETQADEKPSTASTASTDAPANPTPAEPAVTEVVARNPAPAEAATTDAATTDAPTADATPTTGDAPATADAAGSAPTDGRPPIDPADRAAG